MRSFVLLFFLPSFLLAAAEPSVFGAGDLKNPNPYGLTSEEKLILENQKEIQEVVQKNKVQNAKVETVTERLDGLQTIVEGLGQITHEHKVALQKLMESNVEDTNRTLNVEELSKSVTANSENIIQLKTLLEELSKVVDGINADYVSKDEFSALLQQLKLKVASKEENRAKMDGPALEKKAKELFSKKQYAEAQSYYEAMIQKKYKISEAYFHIAESQFQRKGYKEAIYYYKESASKNENASYMPTLLLHTAVSMEKSGDSANAKAFYQATIAKYGNSDAAKEAQERLSKLK